MHGEIVQYLGASSSNGFGVLFETDIISSRGKNLTHLSNIPSAPFFSVASGS
jgi:hypothetical protein